MYRVVWFFVLLSQCMLWVIPSHLVDLLSEGEMVFLGHYSMERLSFNLVALVISFLVLYPLQARSTVVRRGRIFQVATGLLTLIPLALVMNMVLSLTRERTLVIHGMVQ